MSDRSKLITPLKVQRKKIEFPNSDGETLRGLLHLPQPVRAFALFAHCFTCSKDIAAATRISHSLAQLGIAVLRFDFTGLGNSDGDFSNTNFSSNVEDLGCAADYLRQHFQAPQLFIGHSLGGAAVLVAARRHAEVKAVVTIGAPASAAHVKKHFHVHEKEILQQGRAEVELVGRRFTLKKQFLDDIHSYDQDEFSPDTKQALLILHSPLDSIVSIDEAAKIYARAGHPKSFISLDTADHLLANRDDAEYAARLIAVWVGRYL